MTQGPRFCLQLPSPAASHWMYETMAVCAFPQAPPHTRTQTLLLGILAYPLADCCLMPPPPPSVNTTRKSFGTTIRLVMHRLVGECTRPLAMCPCGCQVWGGHTGYLPCHQPSLCMATCLALVTWRHPPEGDECCWIHYAASPPPPPYTTLFFSRIRLSWACHPGGLVWTNTTRWCPGS